MRDNLYQKFYDTSNLKKAYQYIKNEIQDSSLPIDPIWSASIIAIDDLGDSFFESLSKLLRDKKYKPGKADFMYSPKDSLGVRPISVLPVIDRIVYQALLNPYILGDIIDKKLLKNCFGNRIQGKERFLYKYQTKWLQFCDEQIKNIDSGYNWRIEIDISSFYENIHIKKLISTLKEDLKINDENVLNLLGELLSNFSENPDFGIGIPQGPEASHVLANAYLYSFDLYIDNLKKDLDFIFFRYADDMVILSKDINVVHKIVEKINLYFRKYNLKLNEKTKLERFDNSKKIEEVKFYNNYGGINETSEEKVYKIHNQLPNIFKLVNEGKHLDKKENGSLKYYLKASTNFLYVENFIDLIPQKPSLVYLICRYISVGLYLFIDPEQTKIIYSKIWDIYKKNCLDEWTKFWLLKLLSINDYSNNDKNFNREIEKYIASHNNYLSIISLFHKVKSRNPLGEISIQFNLDDIKRLLRLSNSVIEKSIYYYFLIYLKNEEDEKEVLECCCDALNDDALEIQLMGLFVVKFYDFKIERRIVGNLSKAVFKVPEPIVLRPTKIKYPNYINAKFEIPAEIYPKILGLIDDSKKKKATKKSEVIIDNKKGIYIKNRQNKKYAIKGKKRKSVIEKLKNGNIDGNMLASLCSGGNIQQLSKEIGEINKLFKEKLGVRFDLIIHIDTGGYELNKTNYMIKFSG